MVRVAGIVGHATEPRFAGRRVERLRVTWDEASKRRLRRNTDVHTDVAVALPRGAYLGHGDVLDDDGDRIVVVERPVERAVVVRFDDAASPSARLRAAALVGHAFGNQHIPLDIDDAEIRIPVTTSEAIALGTIAALGLPEVRAEVAAVALGLRRPLLGAHANHAHGPHDG
jgi:urease accessory protein